MTLSHEQQIERFGMTTAEAEAIRDRAAAMSPKDVKKARAAWQALSYELRGNKGQPHQCPRHPEAVRFRMLQALADGASIEGATDAARTFAWSED